MLKKYVERHWVVYLSIILISIVFWHTVYDILETPKDNEKFSILFIGDGLDCEGLEQYIVINLGEDRIKSINVENTAVYENLYYDYLKTRCFEYDIIIISKSNMREHVGRVVFQREIMIAQNGDVLPEAECYYENIEGEEIPFGFVLGAGRTDNLFSKYYSGNEECYLFLSPQSVNFAQVNGKGAQGDDFALKVLNALLKK